MNVLQTLAGSQLVGPAGPHSDFDAAEYDRRRAALREVMQREGLDAVLINNRYTHRYFSGHITNLWTNRSRPIFSVFTASGESYAVAVGWEGRRVVNTASDLVLVPYGGSGMDAEPSLEAVRDILVSTVGENVRIGYEGSLWTSYEITEAEMLSLRSKLPKATFLEISTQLALVRMRKSEGEVQALRQAAAINSAAFDTIYTPTARGLTEGDIYRKMSAALFEAGSEEIYFMILNKGDSARQFSVDNPVIFLDSGAVYKGYASDFNRYMTWGKAPAKLTDPLTRLKEVAEVIYEEVRPGRTWKEANQAVYTRSIKILPELATSGTNIGKFGHGIGLQMPELPYLSDDDNTEILEGTVMCIEPSLRHDDMGYLTSVTCEEMVVVRSHGCELLSDGKGAEVREV
ncbi:M24 family metallopeptidase [Micrococcaceae bacterium Sec5.1]